MRLFTLVCFTLLSLQASTLAQSAAPERSLYHRLGGYDEITGFVGLVFPRVVQHPELASLFGGHGSDSQRRQFQMVVELICQKTGGPCHYTGRPMPVVHDGLKITDRQWRTFMTIIDAGLSEKGYAPDVRSPFRAVWEAFRSDVVQR